MIHNNNLMTFQLYNYSLRQHPVSRSRTTKPNVFIIILPHIYTIYATTQKTHWAPDFSGAQCHYSLINYLTSSF